MLNELLQESSGAANISSGRPTLVGFTQKITNQIFKDLVSIQPTKSPIATVYGVRYDLVSRDGTVSVDTQLNHKTGAGAFAFHDHGLGLPSTMADHVAGDMFAVDDYVFEVIVPGNYGTITTKELALQQFLLGNIRAVSDGIRAGEGQDGNEIIQDSRFIMNRWKSEVRTKKLRSPTTIEMLQDMEGQGFDGPAMVEDLLATAMAEEINSDIILKLITLAKKMGSIDIGSVDQYYKGRALIHKATSMGAQLRMNTTFSPTYILASAEVASAIQSSGQVNADRMIIGTSMKLVVDNNAEMNYMLIGCKYSLEDPMEGDDIRGSAAPLYYSPFVQEDDAGTFLIVRDSLSLQPNIGIINRYALTASPHFAEMTVGKPPVDSDDWINLANKSDFAYVCEVLL